MAKDDTYSEATLAALGRSWARLYMGLRSGGVPPTEAAFIVAEWVRVLYSTQQVEAKPADEQDEGGPEQG